MKVTVSAIKADIGGIGGHTKPSEELVQEVKRFVSSNAKDLLIDHYIGYTGDDIHIIMTHTLGTDNQKIHKLAWDAFGKECVPVPPCPPGKHCIPERCPPGFSFGPNGCERPIPPPPSTPHCPRCPPGYHCDPFRGICVRNFPPPPPRCDPGYHYDFRQGRCVSNDHNDHHRHDTALARVRVQPITQIDKAAA